MAANPGAAPAEAHRAAHHAGREADHSDLGGSSMVDDAEGLAAAHHAQPLAVWMAEAEEGHPAGQEAVHPGLWPVGGAAGHGAPAEYQAHPEAGRQARWPVDDAVARAVRAECQVAGRHAARGVGRAVDLKGGHPRPDPAEAAAVRLGRHDLPDQHLGRAARLHPMARQQMAVPEPLRRRPTS